MGTSDRIARFILDALESADGTAELQRSSLADRFGCVPSQINYVIATRFSPERGYMVESRRGGGGCIRITRKQMGRNEYLMHFFCAIGDSIDGNEAVAYLKNLLGAGWLQEREYRLCCAAVSGAALAGLPPAERNPARAQIFKQLILTLMSV